MSGSCSLCLCRLNSTESKKKPPKYKRISKSYLYRTTSGTFTDQPVTKACSVCQVNLPLYGSVCESCSLNGTLCQAVQQLRPCLPHDPGVRTRTRRPKCRRIRLPQSDSEISGIQQQSHNIQRGIQAIPLLWTQEVETSRIQAEQRRDVSVYRGAVIRWLYKVQECSRPVLSYRVQCQRQITRVLGKRSEREASSSATQVFRLYQDEREIQHRRTSQEVTRYSRKKADRQNEIQTPRLEEERSTSQEQPSQPGLRCSNTKRLDEYYEPDLGNSVSTQLSRGYQSVYFNEVRNSDTTNSCLRTYNILIIITFLLKNGKMGDGGIVSFQICQDAELASRRIVKHEPLQIVSNLSSSAYFPQDGSENITLLNQQKFNLILQEQIESLAITGLVIILLQILHVWRRTIDKSFQNIRSEVTSQTLKQFLVHIIKERSK